MILLRGLYRFVDSDDWIEYDMFEVMYEQVIKYQADIVVCGRYEVLILLQQSLKSILEKSLSIIINNLSVCYWKIKRLIICLG